jgi:hypothetical protein
MIRLLEAAFAALLLCTLCVHQPVAQRAGAAPAQPPREITEDEIKAADELRRTLSVEQQALHNGLRYLMRPAFEAELLQGRRYRPCTLEPFEEKGAGPLSLLETLRLWAVLQSGMPSSTALEHQLRRLLETPAPGPELELVQIAVRMLTIRAALQRPELGRVTDLKEMAQELLEAADARRDETSDRSPLVGEAAIEVRWFANHMWRALMNRAALELELKIDDKLWEKDLRVLSAAYVNSRGWPCTRRQEPSANRDLHPNLLALVALGMAQGAPEKAIGNAVLRATEKKLKKVPEILARLEKDYGDEAWGGSRLLAVNSLATDFVPESKSADTWRAEVTRRAVANPDPSGIVWMRHALAAEMGLGDPEWNRAESATCETALNCLALSGGMFAAAPGPLAGLELRTIGRVMHALAVLHAARAGEGADFTNRVNFAIQDGTAFLVSLQLPDGSFPGIHAQSPGNTAYCLLAMMHGGISREHESIQRGIEWLLKNVDNTGSTYDVSVKLMCMQQYYEPEQRKAGILYADTPAEYEQACRKVWESISDNHRSFIEVQLRYLKGSHVGGTNGGWGYGSWSYYSKTGGHSDNSCSQYAVLGYKSASLLGAQFDTRLLEQEAERLIKQYWSDETRAPVVYEHNADEREGDDAERKARSTRAVFRKEIRPGGWGYMCGQVSGASMQMTAAGISSLTICMDELKVRGKLKEKLAQEIGLTIRGAHAWLGGKYYTAEQLSGPKDAFKTSSDGHGAYYNLYSVERACVLAGIRKLEGEVDWYLIGADALLEHQNLDGGWGDWQFAGKAPGIPREQPVSTSMAILFLKRAAPPVITEHKKREKEAEEEQQKPKSPITGK